MCLRLTQPNVNKRSIKLERIIDTKPGTIGNLIMQKTKGKKRQKDLDSGFSIVPYEIVHEKNNKTSILVPGTAVKDGDTVVQLLPLQVYAQYPTEATIEKFAQFMHLDV